MATKTRKPKAASPKAARRTPEFDRFKAGVEALDGLLHVAAKLAGEIENAGTPPDFEDMDRELNAIWGVLPVLADSLTSYGPGGYFLGRSEDRPSPTTWRTSRRCSARRGCPVARKTRTKTATKTTPPTPAELRELIAATLAHYFPHCKAASLAFLPGPGMPPLELVVAGDVFEATRLTDRWFDRAGTGRWEPDDENAEGK